jgi:sugar lactone lactonase YvrE
MPGRWHNGQRTGAAALYRLDPDGATSIVLEGVTVSNGIEWSPDGLRAYYADTATHRVDVFDHDPLRGLYNRRPFIDLTADGLRPDGLTVDADGGVWIALSNGGAIRRYDRTGRLDEAIELPVRKVTACTIGGPGMDTLFIHDVP